jgi:putative transposase
LKRRRYSKDFKRELVEKVLGGEDAKLVARQNALSYNLLLRRIREYKANGEFGNPGGKYPKVPSHISNPGDFNAAVKENMELRKMIDKKNLEISILRDMLKKKEFATHEKVEIAKHWVKRGFCVVTVLEIIGLSRSTYYYQLKNRDKPKNHCGGRPIPGYSIDKSDKRIFDGQIKDWIVELIAGEGYSYGYRKLTVCLKRNYNLIINKKKVYRLCKELGVLKKQRKLKPKYPRKIAKNHIITGPNQLWEADIKYGYISGEERFFYVLSIIDVADRSIIAYHMGLTCEGEDAVTTLKRALLKRNLYESNQLPIIRTDNGGQFVCNAFEEACEKLTAGHERIPPKTPNMNAHIEAFHRIFEEDCLSMYEFEGYDEAKGAVDKFMKYYNGIRIHGSINDMTPNEYYLNIVSGKIKPTKLQL